MKWRGERKRMNNIHTSPWYCTPEWYRTRPKPLGFFSVNSPSDQHRIADTSADAKKRADGRAFEEYTHAGAHTYTQIKRHAFGYTARTHAQTRTLECNSSCTKSRRAGVSPYSPVSNSTLRLRKRVQRKWAVSYTSSGRSPARHKRNDTSKHKHDTRIYEQDWMRVESCVLAMCVTTMRVVLNSPRSVSAADNPVH